MAKCNQLMSLPFNFGNKKGQGATHKLTVSGIFANNDENPRILLKRTHQMNKTLNYVMFCQQLWHLIELTSTVCQVLIRKI